MENLLQDISLLEKNQVYVSHELITLGSDEWEFGWKITWLPLEHREQKRRASHLKTRESFQLTGGATYIGSWPTIKLALMEGISHAYLHICEGAYPWKDYKHGDVLITWSEAEKLKKGATDDQVIKFIVMNQQLFSHKDWVPMRETQDDFLFKKLNSVAFM